MEKNKKTLMLSILGVLSLVLVTIGVTYAFFNYAKEGTTENALTTGTITFIYEEIEAQGAGISIEEAYPISDVVGKQQSGSGKVFNFRVKSTTTQAAIPYTVTARMRDDSTLSQDAVKLYLTELSGDTEMQILLDKYSNLEQTSVEVPEGTVEKVIYKNTVPANSNNYEKNFRLRMWISDDIDFSPVEDEDGNITYPYNGKKFSVTVNVYANAKVVSDEEIAYGNNTNIRTLSVNDTNLTKVEGQDYDYETTLPEGTTSTAISVETENPNATVNIEKIDSLVYNNISNVQRLSTSKTVELTAGDNYFKVTVTSENKGAIKEYKLKLSVLEAPAYTTYNIGDAVTAIDGSKWHVLEASDGTSETVVLLSDYNLNSDGSYNNTCQGVSGNVSTYRCSPMAFDANNATTYNEEDSNNIGYFIKNTYQPLITAALPGTINVTLPTAEQILAGKQMTSDSVIALTNTWLLTTNYWTKSAYSTSNVWFVSGEGSVLSSNSPANISLFFGVRPVITTLKSNLLT